jgi:hypothetical protein
MLWSLTGWPNGFVRFATGHREPGYGKNPPMVPSRMPVYAGLLLSLASWLLIAAPSGSAQVRIIQAGPMEITTDTPEYCQKLLNRIGELVRLAAAPVPHEATSLTTEGERMCDHGQTRGGIMRLRSALLLMEQRHGPAYR